jgi:hypothetical protein
LKVLTALVAEILILHSAIAHLIPQNQCEETHVLRGLKVKKTNAYNSLHSLKPAL